MVERARPTSNDRIRAALWFAERGFGVFPVWSTTAAGTCRCPAGAKCEQPGKHPVTAHGFQDATLDPQRIRTFLAAGSDPNYGLLPPEGVFAWDVDEEDDGIAKLARLEALYGPLPPTLRTNTAHGQHVFLRWPEGVPRPLKKMFGYVTRWGSGKMSGYVIGPRSVHSSGAEYTPGGSGFDIAEVPERWVRAILDGESGPTIRVGGELPKVGGRHDWLRDRARFFRGFMENRDTLRAALLVENARLEQPKTEAEVDRAIGEVFERFPLDPVEEAEDRVNRRLGDDELGLLAPRQLGGFPEPPHPAVFRGLLGECVYNIAGGTDASLVALMGCLIAFVGALVPGSAFFHGTQTSSPFIALVGVSGDGRKTTAMRRVRSAVELAIEPVYVNRAVVDGLSSGEGLVSHLHYKQESYKYEPTVGLVYEEEYASLLASRQREGSTLDPKMRAAFDGGPLSNRRSNETKTVNPPYWLPALIAITPEELRLRLEAGALQSGSANRWLYLAVHRRPDRGANDEPAFSSANALSLVAARRKALDAGNKPLTVENSVRDRLSFYQDFVSDSFGITRDLVRRLGAIAFRVALVHALAERSAVVTDDHAERALALVEYGRQGIPWVFGETVGSPDADLLLRHLVATGRLTKTLITREIIRDPIRRQGAIDELVRLGRASVVNVQTQGRPRTELIPSGREGASFPNFQVLLTELDERLSGLGNKAQSEPEPAARKVEKSREEADTKLEISRTEVETIDCRDYQGHATKYHHRTANGWVCDACSGSVTGSSDTA